MLGRGQSLWGGRYRTGFAPFFPAKIERRRDSAVQHNNHLRSWFTNASNRIMRRYRGALGSSGSCFELEHSIALGSVRFALANILYHPAIRKLVQSSVSFGGSFTGWVVWRGRLRQVGFHNVSELSRRTERWVSTGVQHLASNPARVVSAQR